MTSVAEAVKTLRAQAGVTLDEMAADTGVSKGTIINAEQGKNVLTNKLAELGVPYGKKLSVSYTTGKTWKDAVIKKTTSVGSKGAYQVERATYAFKTIDSLDKRLASDLTLGRAEMTEDYYTSLILAEIAQEVGFEDIFLLRSHLFFAKGREGILALAIEQQVQEFLTSDDADDEELTVEDGHGAKFTINFSDEETITVKFERLIY